MCVSSSEFPSNNEATFLSLTERRQSGIHNGESTGGSASVSRKITISVSSGSVTVSPEIVTFRSYLPDGNEAKSMQGRDDGKEAGEYSPLFYRKDKYELLDGNTFWLSQYPDSAGFIGWDGACTRIATWGKFKDKKTGKVFMAVNTHFDHVGVEARRQSALLIIQKIKEIVGDNPAVVTGDFNVNDQSEAYQTITTNEFVLKDAYKMTDKKTGPNYTFHDFGRYPVEKREKIDFIFVTPQIKVLNTEIAQNPESKTGYLSDHNPHMALIEF